VNVGDLEGFFDTGEREGESVGLRVGECEGKIVGLLVGDREGLFVGDPVGDRDTGERDGEWLGRDVVGA